MLTAQKNIFFLFDNVGPPPKLWHQEVAGITYGDAAELPYDTSGRSASAFGHQSLFGRFFFQNV
jgi:hypothetical protein